MRLDREFHLLTYAGASYPFLTDLVTRLWNITQPYRRELVRQMPDGSFRSTCAEHTLIVDALRRRDPDAAAALVHVHIHRTRVALSGYRDIVWQNEQDLAAEGRRPATTRRSADDRTDQRA